MDVGEWIAVYRERAGLTIEELARRSGVSKGTINKIIGGETKSPTIAVMGALARALGRSLSDFDGRPAQALSNDALDLARDYEAMDSHGRRVLLAVLEQEKQRMSVRAAEEKRPAVKVIPLIGNSFAAGRGEPDFGNPWEDYEVPADSPADFAVRINGNSMEPYLPDGSVALGRKQTPRDGDVAALLLDGEFLCKQVCQDMAGNLYLFALNRDRRDADVTLFHDAERSLTCFGTIIMERAPLPTEL